ncbi:hypothetical protein J4E08_08105 [Sagittula sp. NFXS13]|uniref:hypothetical protein n=1 Tax=Sagittula sp. NFXS13 TaxID=2819095 RepID=UPI0032DEC5ED
MSTRDKTSRITASLASLRAQMDAIKAQHSEIAGSYGLLSGRAMPHSASMIDQKTPSEMDDSSPSDNDQSSSTA